MGFPVFGVGGLPHFGLLGLGHEQAIMVLSSLLAFTFWSISNYCFTTFWTGEIQNRTMSSLHRQHSLHHC